MTSEWVILAFNIQQLIAKDIILVRTAPSIKQPDIIFLVDIYITTELEIVCSIDFKKSLLENLQENAFTVIPGYHYQNWDTATHGYWMFSCSTQFWLHACRVNHFYTPAEEALTEW